MYLNSSCQNLTILDWSVHGRFYLNILKSKFEKKSIEYKLFTIADEYVKKDKYILMYRCYTCYQQGMNTYELFLRNFEYNENIT